MDLGGGRSARLLTVDLGSGLEATITTPFSGVPDASPARHVGQTTAPDRLAGGEVVVDLDLHGVGKVLSVAVRNGVNRLIGMKPGPWEEHFGLSRREWTPGVARRLAGGA